MSLQGESQSPTNLSSTLSPPFDHLPQEMRKISTVSVVPNATVDGPFEPLWGVFYLFRSF